MIAHLYHPGLGRFVRGLFPDQEGKLVPDYTMDASMYGLFAFEALLRMTPDRVYHEGHWHRTVV